MPILANLNEIAAAFRGQRTPHGIKFRCPCHEDSSPSCTAWYGERAIMVKCFAGCDNAEVIRALQKRGFVTSVPEPVPPPLISRQRREDAELRRQYALRLWQEAKAFAGSLAERYLADVRLLDFGLIDDIDATLRFHPRCPRGRDSRVPALLGAFRHIDTDQIVAVQRIFLTPSGVKDGKPMMLGPVADAAVKLTSHKRTFSGGKCDRINICEGVETGIGAMMMGFSPQWVLGSTSGIRRFLPRPSMAEVCVCTDPDEPGIAAAQECIRNWIDAGFRARGVMPGGSDG